ncbi:hypothetical protein, partial [Lujinxingia sediminis]|uniref:hypothetical protein n=1 Tax=Lujinxingia sediminis TaxID=2480984 RepID=UPI0019CF9209
LIAKIDDLKARAKTRDTMRYPRAFKDDAVELVSELSEQGWTQQAIGEALEIPWVTLNRWRDAATPGEEQAENFRPVTLSEPKTQPALVSPSGWRIEGLSVAQLIEVARRLP